MFWTPVCWCYNASLMLIVSTLVTVWSVLVGGIWFLLSGTALIFLFLGLYTTAVGIAKISPFLQGTLLDKGTSYGADLSAGAYSIPSMMAFFKLAFRRPWETIKVLFQFPPLPPPVTGLIVTEATIKNDFLGLDENDEVPLLKGKPSWPYAHHPSNRAPRA